MERRLLAYLWLLADRWGRVTPDGVVVPIVLTHRLLGQLVGARRPTVSAALARLATGGRVLPRAGGGWLLNAPPPPLRHGHPQRRVPPRRALLTPAAG